MLKAICQLQSYTAGALGLSSISDLGSDSGFSGCLPTVTDEIHQLLHGGVKNTRTLLMPNP
jgi:hypothetical protein